VFLPVYVVILVMAASSIKILREYERAVVFRLGRFQAVRARTPFHLSVRQQIVRVDLRTVVLQVPSQTSSRETTFL